MTEDLRPPYRIQFDNARDPYTARNALGIAGTGAGLITSVTSPLSVTGGNLTIDLSGYVSNSGTPAAGQVAEWVTATTIKGVSTYAKLASPAFTGTPTAPTPANTDSSTTIATTAFVRTGTATNNAAAAGQIGEYVSAGVGVSVPASTFVAAASIALTAGDWDISAVGEFNSGTAGARAFVSVSTNSAGFGAVGSTAMVPISSSLDAYVTTALVRASIAITTTYYCVLLSDSVVGSCAVRINARRVR